MLHFPGSLVLALVLVFCSASFRFPAIEPTAPRSIATEVCHYRDKSRGHVTSQVTLELRGRAGNFELVAHLSAVGPHVEPPRGYRGVRGANRITAQELELLLQLGLSVVNQHQGSRDISFGRMSAGTRGPLPERRIGTDGKLEVAAWTEQDYLLELRVESGALPPGVTMTELQFNGEPRMRVRYRVTGDEAHILAFESLDEGASGIDAGLAVVARPWAQAGDEAPPPLDEVWVADWQELDNEGKWVRYATSSRKDPSIGRAWVAFLRERKDYEFLEWIAVFDAEAFVRDGVGDALLDSSAPQWIRCHVWRLPRVVGSALVPRTRLEDNAGIFMAWIEKYPAANVGTAGRIYDRFKEDDPSGKRGDPAGQLPPLKPADVFRALDAPAKLEDFGDRKKSEPGVTYLHQVERAIQAFVSAGHYRDPWLEKLYALTTHADMRVQRSSLLALMELPEGLVPLRVTEPIYRDTAEQPEVRRAALMAFSASGHPKVYRELLTLSADPTHPCWRVALSRIGDLDAGFAPTILNRIDRDKLSVADRELLDAVLDGISLRAGQPLAPPRGRFQQLLESAAWLESPEDPLQKQLADWTLEFCRPHARRHAAELTDLARIYTPHPGRPELQGAFAKRVRGYARELLDGPGTRPNDGR